MQGFYLASSRELTRLDSITKAPIIHHFSETITGVMTIRSFRKQGIFCQENIDRVNANLRMDFHNNGSNEWLGFRLELIGSIFLCIATMFMVLLPSNIIKPGIVHFHFFLYDHQLLPYLFGFQIFVNLVSPSHFCTLIDMQQIQSTQIKFLGDHTIHTIHCALYEHIRTWLIRIVPVRCHFIA